MPRLARTARGATGPQSASMVKRRRRDGRKFPTGVMAYKGRTSLSTFWFGLLIWWQTRHFRQLEAFVKRRRRWMEKSGRYSAREIADFLADATDLSCWLYPRMPFPKSPKRRDS